ncbi:hypothetical protein LX15_000260 [Streptoalloteichus tenebrarius]|uniref:Integral membrane protein n=1 Tax=Streptoalloteichus tenebrarius (strain ATCC 17920 / DSM 40477 / JCM 4838 / CBS 697.72 / NBRC 16177 / NCIMB 11028 / NRRL B-12390 / A12253. 1 / ISP 5477) TaxID=1933 RepID=A0ABT1HM30_STRSD|nr:hypothetical protein [Streptoalloteichus tenebrarius]MCP2256577.1 hypothetical protein [Streptoalloteichus tenebrarius]BFF04929.1 hypothetical protein GCM10020241_66040 [Streptoalloteichus tenebrarius]
MSVMTARAARGATPRDGTPDLLRRSLRVDGVGTAVFGAVMLAGGRWLADPLGLPGDWFAPIGIGMLGGAAALGLIAGYPRVPAGLARAAIAANALSGAVMLPLAVTGALPLTGLGVAFMLAGAAWVLTFAGLTFAGLRQSGSHA